MGARLSRPRGPDGMTESSAPVSSSPRAKLPQGRINSRTIVAPAAAFTMAILLFVYTRTSIRAAKSNAQRHREADTGGAGLSLINEDRRRHGLAPRLDGGGNTVFELASEARAQLLGSKKRETTAVGDEGKGGSGKEEERLRALKDDMRRRTSSKGG